MTIQATFVISDKHGFFVPKVSKEMTELVPSLSRITNMSEQKQYMNLSLDDPYSSTPPEYSTSDELLDAIDTYIAECEAQNDLRGLTQLENSLDVGVNK